MKTILTLLIGDNIVPVPLNVFIRLQKASQENDGENH